MSGMRTAKKVALTLFIELVAGALLSVLFLIGAPAERDIMILLYVFPAAAVFGVVLVLLISGAIDSRFYSKLDKNMRVMTSEMKVHEYIALMSELVKKTGSKYNRAIAGLDLATGYSCAGEYGKAVEILNSIDVRFLQDRRHRAVYYNNLVEFLLCASDIESAEKVYNTNKEYFDGYMDDSGIAAGIISTVAHLEFARGNLSISEEMFMRARSCRNLNIHMLNCIDMYLACIYLQTNRREKSEAILNYVQSFNVYPAVREMIEMLKFYLNSDGYEYDGNDKTDDIVVEASDER